MPPSRPPVVACLPALAVSMTISKVLQPSSPLSFSIPSPTPIPIAHQPGPPKPERHGGGTRVQLTPFTHITQVSPIPRGSRNGTSVFARQVVMLQCQFLLKGTSLGPASSSTPSVLIRASPAKPTKNAKARSIFNQHRFLPVCLPCSSHSRPSLSNLVSSQVCPAGPRVMAPTRQLDGRSNTQACYMPARFTFVRRTNFCSRCLPCMFRAS